MEGKRFLLYEVWEPLIRFLHWFNCFFIVVLLSLGGILFFKGTLNLSPAASETILHLHVYAGYPLAAGILLRWIWLFIGEPFSTWKDILPLREEQRRGLIETLLWYVRGLRGRPPFYIAHNPLAGIAYGTFFVFVALQVVTGLILNQIPPLPSGERRPPLFLILPHDTGFIVILLYVLIHIPMVLIHELKERRSIVSAMIHGKKVFEEGEREGIERYRDLLKG